MSRDLCILSGALHEAGADLPNDRPLESFLNMSIKAQERDGAAVIQIKGKFLGSVDGPELKQKMDDFKQAGKTNIVIDLGQTDFMDSSGIGALISGLTSMRKAGGDVRLANMEKRIQGLFVM